MTHIVCFCSRRCSCGAICMLADTTANPQWRIGQLHATVDASAYMFGLAPGGLMVAWRWATGGCWSQEGCFALELYACSQRYTASMSHRGYATAMSQLAASWHPKPYPSSFVRECPFDCTLQSKCTCALPKGACAISTCWLFCRLPLL